MRELLMILCCLILVQGCETRSEQIEQQDPENLRNSLKPTGVTIQNAEVRPFEYLIHTTGKVRASKSIEIKFKTTGQIAKLGSHNGIRVKQGQLLALLNDDKQQLSLKKAKAELEQRKFEYESQMLSYSEKNIPSEQTEIIKNNIRHTSGLVQAELNYEDAQLQLSHTQLIAPFDGIIANQETTSGNYINTGDKLCDIYSPDQLEIISYILEGDLSQIDIGNVAEIKPIEGNIPSRAVISEINPQVNEEGLVQIVLTISNKKSNLLPGMNTEVLIKIPKQKNIIVPKEAIVVRSGKEVIFVAEDNHAKWHYVTTDSDNGKEVEILEGLEPNDPVIITNNLQLAHDALVAVE